MYNVLMKRLAGTQIDDRTFYYDGALYQTNRGYLLNFHEGSDTWKGIFPGTSWDEYYDEILPLLSNRPTAQAQVDRMTDPTVIWPLKPVDTCQFDRCNNKVQNKYCSIECWYTTMLERTRRSYLNAKNDRERLIKYNFLQRLEIIYGPILEENFNQYRNLD